MGSNIVKSAITLLIVGIAGLLGFTITPDSGLGLGLFSAIAGLGVKVQVGILVALVLLVGVPFLAPYTPWTWDDRTIQYKSAAGQLFARLWNLLSHNFGNASNKPSS